MNRHLRKGIRLWNQGRYWECHEAWERTWLELKGRERSYLQGCIQAAAVQVLLSKNRHQAAARVAARALELLGDRMPRTAAGLQLPRIPGIRGALRSFLLHPQRALRFSPAMHR